MSRAFDNSRINFKKTEKTKETAILYPIKNWIIKLIHSVLNMMLLNMLASRETVIQPATQPPPPNFWSFLANWTFYLWNTGLKTAISIPLTPHHPITTHFSSHVEILKLTWMILRFSPKLFMFCQYLKNFTILIR